MISSSTNAQIKKIIQLNQKTKARRQEGLFVAEGKKMFLEAPADWMEKIYISEGCLAEGFSPDRKTADGRTVPVEVVTDGVFRQMSDTCTPQGILTLLRIPAYTLEDLEIRREPIPGADHTVHKNGLYLVLEDLQDPGNLGTIFRTAEAAGATGIFLTEGCVDVTNPKVIRGTMGAVYRLPWYPVKNVKEAGALLASRRVECLAAALNGDADYDAVDYTGGCAFLIGNEGNGLTQEALDCTDRRIRIPMCGRTESLNAAMAAGILLYEAFRQRRRLNN